MAECYPRMPASQGSTNPPREPTDNERLKSELPRSLSLAHLSQKRWHPPLPRPRIKRTGRLTLLVYQWSEEALRGCERLHQEQTVQDSLVLEIG